MILKDISVLHRKIQLVPCDTNRMKGLTVGEKLSYTFYEGVHEGTLMLCFATEKRKSHSERM